MLDGAKLGEEIAACLTVRDPKSKQVVQKIWQEVAQVICAHIVQNAEVMEGINVNTPSGPGLSTSKGKIQ